MKTMRFMPLISKLQAILIGGLLSLASAAGYASDAETSASATAGRGSAGTATGTARYNGDVGFARSDTRTGAVNSARSVAVGVDPDGVSLSFSLALAPNGGPAIATNFNMSIGTDGQVATSNGVSVASGGVVRTATAGGQTGVTPAGASATSVAGGQTLGGGRVNATVHSDSTPAAGELAVAPRGVVKTSRILVREQPAPAAERAVVVREGARPIVVRESAHPVRIVRR